MSRNYGTCQKMLFLFKVCLSYVFTYVISYVFSYVIYLHFTCIGNLAFNEHDFIEALNKT